MSRRPATPPFAGMSTQSGEHTMSDEAQLGTDEVPLAVHAQFLAAEHYSLLATRSMTQSEVLSRITTFLMLLSGSIVGLALTGQVTHFDGRFITFALVLVGMLVLVGGLTQLRVGTAGIEDLAHVIGMNRLRAGYLELDPAIERYFVTSAHDDDAGLWQTYNFLLGQRTMLQPLASTGAFITFLNAGLAGVFAALVMVALKVPRPLVGVVGAVCVLSYLGISIGMGLRQYLHVHRQFVSLFPSPEAAGREQ